jgi:uncharacterized membrane protein
MARLVPLGRAFFAIALIGLGVDHFIFGEFITGRAPAWPESVPGGPAWAYLTGIVFVATGLAILAGRRARAAATVAGALIFLWALLRHLPVVAASSFLSADWTRAGKAAWFVGGCLAVAATFPTIADDRNSSFRTLLNRDQEFVVAGRVALGLFQILTGIQHFKFTAFVASLIPPWFPGAAVFWTYFGGVALIAGGIGLLLPPTARWAALFSGVMIFSWFFIVHVSREIARVADGIAVFEALGAAGVLFVIAGLRSPQQVGPAAFTPDPAAALPRPRGTR